MFKNTFYKIITIAGLLAGMVGPQVVTGMELPPDPAQAVSPHDQEAIPVISSQTEGVEVQVVTDMSCTNSLTWRIDLLLWQSCDMAIHASQPENSPLLVVTESPHENLQVAVMSGPQLERATHVSSSAQQSDFIVLNASIIVVAKQSKNTAYNVYAEQKITPSLKISVNNQGYTVMRC
jgi:hypothetical protein